MLAAWYAGATLVVVGAFAGALVVGYDALATRSLDAANALALGGAAETIAWTREGPRVRAAEFAEEASELRSAFGVLALRVVGDGGRTLARADAPGGPVLETRGPEAETLRAAGHAWRVARRRFAPGAGEGPGGGVVVVAARQADETEAGKETLVRALAVAVPLAALLALGAAWGLAGLALRPVRASFERQRRFLADASHTLRTPIAVVLSQAEVSERADLGTARGALAEIAAQARRMGAIVADLLFLARAEGEAALWVPKRFYLDDLLEDLAGAWAPLVEARGLALEWAPAAADVPVEGDPERLIQAFECLLENALRYTPAPGRVRLALAVDARHERASVMVGDSGPGLAPGDEARIFERFYRAGGARRVSPEGTGLGLAIARAIAEAHGGGLDAGRDGVLGGAAFTLTLPLAAPAPAPEPVPEAPPG